MIEGRSLRKICQSTIIADQLDFKLINGSVYGILDPSGANVGAFLALLAGAIKPDAGFIRINGFDTVKDSTKVRECIGYVSKNLIPYPDMTPEEYLTFIAEAHGLDYEDGIRRVQELLDAAELRGRKRSLCTHLSRGEAKRLCLAQALVGDPEILILDDPCKGLGERDAYDLLDRIDLLAETKTILLGSTSLSFLRSTCDKILVLSKGKLTTPYEPNDRALDDLFASLCTENGTEMTDADASHTRIKKKKHSKRAYTPPKKRGEYELIDDDSDER